MTKPLPGTNASVFTPLGVRQGGVQDPRNDKRQQTFISDIELASFRRWLLPLHKVMFCFACKPFCGSEPPNTTIAVPLVLVLHLGRRFQWTCRILEGRWVIYITVPYANRLLFL